MPRLYTVAEVEADPVTLNSRLGTYTNFVNLLDLCAFAVPAGAARRRPAVERHADRRRRRGRPARRHRRGASMRAPARRSALRAWRRRRRAAGRAAPATASTSRSSARISPGCRSTANWSNSARVFVREVETTPDYRLFALPGSRQAWTAAGRGRRGRVRSRRRSGRSTRPLSAPSSPRSLPARDRHAGFADGTAAKGFLVEAEAVKAAEDVSRSAAGAPIWRAGSLVHGAL